ncbi:peptidoglycan/LPS O-acetylase OafA/YrhL [Ruminococcaceae bacterium R-25]|nr:peptidoglycan/LPS O-acetylase OafA/YrhL [Ruminococcaceae bacterium R-25]SUQ11499.1 Peptidoglycan/LPS O-acetylase OafA/YrhL, contains acyltransferase and SGNH-hydrolase domains [Oscillospiraceae bacterium]
MGGENSDISKNGFKQISRYRSVLMGLAAIWIFVFHAWIPVFNEPSGTTTSVFHNIEEFVRRTGFYGVDIFLLLSGIGLTFAIKKESLLKFYYRRIRRVYLPFLLAALIRWPFAHWSIWEFFKIITGISFYTEHIHVLCWFVPAIISLYLVFPLYYKFFSKAKKKFLFTAVSITIWLILSILLDGTMRYDLYGFTNRIPIFLIGIYFGDIIQRQKELEFTLKHYVIMLLTLVAGLFLAYLYVFMDFEIILSEELLVLPGILISISSSFLIAKVMNMLEISHSKIFKFISSVLGFWGAISLELYCACECLLVSFSADAIRFLAGIGFKQLPINIVLFAAITLAAWIASLLFKYFWKLVELSKSNRKVDNKVS